MKIIDRIFKLFKVSKPQNKNTENRHTKENCDFCYVDKCIDAIGKASKNKDGMTRELMDTLADDRFINFLRHSGAKFEGELK